MTLMKLVSFKKQSFCSVCGKVRGNADHKKCSKIKQEKFRNQNKDVSRGT